MNVWGKILRFFGWQVEITVPRTAKCIICVAPHTSNWDFILGILAYKSLGRKANFLMKKFWFFFPLKYLLVSLGGIPVDRKRKGESLTDQIIRRFESSDYMNLAVTPEGTRSRVTRWKTGFLYMAYGAHVPIQLGVIDYKHKKVIIKDMFDPSGDVTADMQYVKKYYAGYVSAAKYPEKFTV